MQAPLRSEWEQYGGSEEQPGHLEGFGIGKKEAEKFVLLLKDKKRGRINEDFNGQ